MYALQRSRASKHDLSPPPSPGSAERLYDVNVVMDRCCCAVDVAGVIDDVGVVVEVYYSRPLVLQQYPSLSNEYGDE